MKEQSLIADFQKVDHSEYEYLIQFLEKAAAYPVIRESLEFQMNLLDLKPGDHVLDVGCGAGIQAEDMAKRVAPSGRVTGTDISSVMIQFAKTKSAESGLPLDFHVAKAESQPFPDQSFDAVRTERVMLYLKNTKEALNEFKRLLKPGGKLVIFDLHWDGVLLSHRDKTFTRRIVHYITDAFPNGHFGGDLYYHLKDAGFNNVSVTPYSYFGGDETLLNIVKKAYKGILEGAVSEGKFTETEISEWWKSVDEDMEAGKFFVSLPGMIGFGTKD
ncbi:methyltransferase domain-containing protein [Chryseobacterium sp. MYb264]|uniref:methyltransferase domain-containing protein n=1 Tax=Chryseobacterium sp. MYb264 TaxID=2745153 RepID=UPI002E13DDB8|nr:methyltransferase domain-containing protein [Chryseobacterium sp. MYb264]